MGSSWAAFQPAQVPHQDDCVASEGFMPAQHRGVKEQKLLFLLVDLAETVYTLYGKCSISAAGNGNFRQETERMWELMAEYWSCRLQVKLFPSRAILTSAI